MGSRTILLLSLLLFCPAAFSQDAPGILRAVTNQIQDPTTAQGLVDRAAERSRSGDFDGAITDLTRAMALDPSNAQTVDKRGVAKWRKKDFDGAIADFTKAIELDPKFAMAYFNRGVNREDKGDLDGAIPDYTRAIELDPSKASFSQKLELAKLKKADPAAAGRMDALRKLWKSATSKFVNQDYDGSIADATQAIQLDPTNAVAYSIRAQGKSFKEDFAGSIADWTKAIELEPRNAESWGGRARAEFDSGDYLSSKEDSDKANAINPNNSTASYLPGQIAEKLANPGAASNAYTKSADKKFDRGDYDGSIADATKAIQIAPTFSLPYIIRGNAYLEKKQYDAAVADATKFIQLEPNSGMGQNLRGFVYLDKGDLDQALIDFNAAIAIEPELADAYDGRGQVYKRNGDYDRSIADLTKALQFKPEFISAIWDRGGAYAGMGKYDLAIADFNTVLRSEMNNAEAYNYRGFAYLQIGNLDKAVADLNRSIQIDPKHAYAYRNRGDALLKQGNTDQALLDYNKAVELDPNYAPNYSGRSTAYYQKGNYDLGIADLTKSASLDKKQSAIPIYRAWGYLYANKNDLAFEQVTTFLELNGLKGTEAPYAVIVGYLALRKSNKAAAAKAFLDEWIGQLPADQWTTDLVAHLHGDLPAGQLLTRADTNGKLTEAHTYIGEMQMLAGTANLAKIHFEWVKENGVKDFFEYFLVNSDMDRMAGGLIPKYVAVPAGKTGLKTKPGTKPVPAAGKTSTATASKVVAPATTKAVQAQAFLKSGLAKLKESNEKGAYADFTKAIELDPGFAEAYLQRGKLFLDSGDKDLADLSKAIALNPRLAEAYYERAIWIREYGDSEDFQKHLDLRAADLNKAIELNPKYSLAYGERAMVKSYSGATKPDLKGAIADYTKAIQFDPDNYYWYQGRGALYRQLGQTALADADDKKAEALGNRSPN